MLLLLPCCCLVVALHGCKKNQASKLAPVWGKSKNSSETAEKRINAKSLISSRELSFCTKPNHHLLIFEQNHHNSTTNPGKTMSSEKSVKTKKHWTCQTYNLAKHYNIYAGLNCCQKNHENYCFHKITILKIWREGPNCKAGILCIACLFCYLCPPDIINRKYRIMNSTWQCWYSSLIFRAWLGWVWFVVGFNDINETPPSSPQMGSMEFLVGISYPPPFSLFILLLLLFHLMELHRKRLLYKL